MDPNEAEEVATFDDIDTNGDGYISKDELYAFIKDQRSLHSELFWIPYFRKQALFKRFLFYLGPKFITK